MSEYSLSVLSVKEGEEKEPLSLDKIANAFSKSSNQGSRTNRFVGKTIDAGPSETLEEYRYNWRV
jgi:hypothetical protein